MGCTDEKTITSKPIKRGKINPSLGSINSEIEKKHNVRHIDNLNDESEKKEQNKDIQLDLNSTNKHHKNENNNKEEEKNNKEVDYEHKQTQIKGEVENNDSMEIKEGGLEDLIAFEQQLNEEKEEEEEEEMNECEEEEFDRHRHILREVSPYLQSKVNPNFNYPNSKDNVYVGKGLKKMRGYICIVPKEELPKIREAFWGTRVEGDPMVWTFLKELCELPEEEQDNIPAMLEANDITPLKKCLNVTYDNSGMIYEIPNYCINDPVSYDLPENHVKKPEKKNICFHARKGTKQVKIKASNYTSIEKVKVNIAQKLEIKDEKNVRMFFRGKELKNGNELWTYNIQDDDVIVVMGS